MISCPVCDGSHCPPAFRVNEHDLFRCGNCGTVFVHPPPTSAQLTELYGREDYYDGARRQEARLRTEALDRARRLKHSGARSVLDVGCAAGYFLDAGRELGLEMSGVEPGPAANDAVGRGHTVHRKWLGELDLGDVRFDAVTLWEVVEHVVDPIQLLRAAVSLVRPGGILALSTPSMSGLPARLLGARFPMVTPPEHLTLLTRESAELLLRKCELEPIRITSFSNLGPEQLRAGFNRFIPEQFRALRSAARLASGHLVAATALMDRLGLGSELEIFARRAR